MDILPVVAAALIDADGLVLVQRRPAGRPMAGLWEFPGGKIEPGETPEVALVRELREELGIVVAPAALTPITFASTALDVKHLLLLLFTCRLWEGVATSLEGGEVRWLAVSALDDLPMPPADRPLLRWLAALP